MLSTNDLQVIARAGIASRRRAEDIICDGKVKVNGNVITVPQHPVLLNGADKVRFSLPMNPDAYPIKSHSRMKSHTDF